MKGFSIIICFFLLSLNISSQQVIPLYSGSAPGSESWTHQEKTDTLRGPNNYIFVSNVVNPSLIVYRPEKPNGMAMIVCPGGAFRALSIQSEGTDVARWLNTKGITAFVLKYRLVPGHIASREQAMEDIRTQNSRRIDSLNAPYVPLAVADGREAVKYVRTHAAEWGLHPNRIGIMGFSAGGTVAASVALTPQSSILTPQSSPLTPQSMFRPDFAAPIYAYCGAIEGNQVPADAPPLFLAFSQDDFISDGNPALYQKWKAAGRPAEMHVYPDGGHGYGIRKQGKASDGWENRLAEWLNYQFPVQEFGSFWKDLDYVGDQIPGHKLDIHLPYNKKGPFPVMVAIYGSAWFSNNAKQNVFRENLGRRLLEAGYAVVSINHRSSRDALFPAQIQDVKAAIRFVRAHAGKYQLDTSFIGITGWSSGGHLSALAGVTGDIRRYTLAGGTMDLDGSIGPHTGMSCAVDAVVDWFGPVDFLIMDSCGSSFSHNGPYSPESFLMGSPIQEIKTKVAFTNPVHYIHPGTPPFLIFHGDQDFQVPACQSQKLHEHLRMKNIQSESIVVPGGGHGPGVMIDYYYDKMIRFLDGELKKGK